MLSGGGWHYKCVLLTVTVLLSLQSEAAEEFRRDTVLMGVSVNIGVVHEDARFAHRAISAGFAEIVRVERLISSWDKESQTSEINRQAGMAPVKVDRELFDLILRAKKISEISNGHFDISFSSIHRIWDFEHFSQDELPTEEQIANSIKLIDHTRIQLNHEHGTVYLQDKGMKIGFGAIGKGYAANRVRALLIEMGVENGLVNAGGDLIAWGSKSNGEPWSVGITDPFDKKAVVGSMAARDVAIVTSGNYEKFVEIDGVRYCHIIDPKTGWPVENLASVTVVSPDAEFADALATTVFVLGREDGMKLVDHLEGVECLIIDSDGNRYLSANLEARYWKDEKDR